MERNGSKGSQHALMAGIVLLAVLFLPIAILLMLAVDQLGGLSASAAAWVQAIGSLVGIGVAIAIPAWQHRREVKAAEIARLDIEIGYTRRLFILAKELEAALAQAYGQWPHYGAEAKGALRVSQIDFQSRLFEGLKADQNTYRVMAAGDLRKISDGIVWQMTRKGIPDVEVLGELRRETANSLIFVENLLDVVHFERQAAAE
ncbi:hypothetical protein [Marinobacter sp.]|uniref:hypothetical protein n=1 Tax=Marinobacter sp. TaxID=50741 RepID=UPI003A95A33B